MRRRKILDISTILIVGILVATVSILAACEYPYGAYVNQPLPPKEKEENKFFDAGPRPLILDRPTNRDELGPYNDRDKLANDVFVGVSLSGGGIRAANFSAAVLFELKDLGLLKHVNAISTVSGGSLAGAYFGLYHDTDRWNRKQVKKDLGHDFETDLMYRLIYPQNILRMIFTDFDRNDVMRQVFDDRLFDDHTFADLTKKRPQILINATSLGDLFEKRFVFRGSEFDKIESRLNSYPVAAAVMASAAFPGAFHGVTLGNFSADKTLNGIPTQFVHLIDGGPTDNLGISTLSYLASKYNNKRKLRGCFLFIVDSHPSSHDNNFDIQRLSDTRRWYDMFLDMNLMDAADILLAENRIRLLTDIGFAYDRRILDPITVPVQDISLFSFLLKNLRGIDEVERKKEEANLLACRVWHIATENLSGTERGRRYINQIVDTQNLNKEQKKDMEVYGHMVNAISTRFRLDIDSLPKGEGSRKDRENFIQHSIFEAAKYLIRQDKISREKACKWFQQHGFKGVCPG